MQSNISNDIICVCVSKQYQTIPNTEYLQTVSHKPAKLILTNTYRFTHLKLKFICKPAFKQNSCSVVR